MNKRLFSTLALALCAILVCASVQAAEAETATVEVPDFQGTLSVTLRTADGVITDVQVSRTAGATVGDEAVESLPARMVEANSPDVDIVSGATYTSQAIIGAAKAALAELGVGDADMLAAWAEAKGYVLAADYRLVTGVDGVSGSSYNTEVGAQGENNLLSQEEARELTLDYLRGYPMYYHLREGADIGADVIFVQSNIDLFTYLNSLGGSYGYGDSYTGPSGRIYTYSLPSCPLDTADYLAGIQLGPDTQISDEAFAAAIGEAEYSYREMYAIGTAYNNVPGLAQSEAVLDPESMLIYLGSNAGSEKSLELAVNPVIRMYWINGINEHNYVSGSSVTDNDYYHSYGVRIEGSAGAVDIATVIDGDGSILRESVVRGGIRYGMSITGAQEWFEAHPDQDMEATAAMLAESRYFAGEWAGMREEQRQAASAEVLGYMAKIYLGEMTEEGMYPVDVADIEAAGKEISLSSLKSVVMNRYMNRSGEGYAIRLASTGALLEVVPEQFLTNTLWIISDCSTEEQVALYEAGSNAVMAKWAGRFYELYTKLEEGQTTTQLRRQVYYAAEDESLDR